METQYFRLLAENELLFRTKIDQLLTKYKAIPVGKGYIDLIISREKAVGLTKELAQLPVAVTSISWWCLCTPESRLQLGCPHGYGGPINRFGEGWFSECVQYPIYEVSEHIIALSEISDDSYLLVSKYCNHVCSYLEDGMTRESYYKECLYPGLWLKVPENWERINYFI